MSALPPCPQLLPGDQEIQIEVAPRSVGARVDRFLNRVCPGISRAKWQKALKSGGILVDGQRVRPSRPLREGETVCFYLSSLGLPELLLDPRELGEAIFEDSDVVAFAKPSGLLTHPAGHLVLRSASVFAKRLLQAEVYPCHRLDKYTSGALIFGKTSARAHELSQSLLKRDVEKRYLALSRFPPPAPEFVVDLPLDQTGEEHVKLKMLPSKTGKPSRTEFKVLAEGREGTLFACRPRTGRQHQIRAHLLFVGCPIVGDLLYGPEEDLAYFDDGNELKHAAPDGRWHALHCLGMRFPWRGDWLTIEAPVSGEFRARMPQGLDLRAFGPQGDGFTASDSWPCFGPEVFCEKPALESPSE